VSHRAVTKVNPEVASTNNRLRRPSPLCRGEGSMRCRKLTDAAAHSGGVVRDSTVTRACRSTGETVLVPSLAACGRVDRRDQSDLAWLGELVCVWPLEPVFLVYPRLGRKEDAAPPGASLSTPRIRLEAVESGMAVWDARAFQ